MACKAKTLVRQRYWVSIIVSTEFKGHRNVCFKLYHIVRPRIDDARYPGRYDGMAVQTFDDRQVAVLREWVAGIPDATMHVKAANCTSSAFDPDAIPFHKPSSLTGVLLLHSFPASLGGVRAHYDLLFAGTPF